MSSYVLHQNFGLEFFACINDYGNYNNGHIQTTFLPFLYKVHQKDTNNPIKRNMIVFAHDRRVKYLWSGGF